MPETVHPIPNDISARGVGKDNGSDARAPIWPRPANGLNRMPLYGQVSCAVPRIVHPPPQAVITLQFVGTKANTV